MDRKYSDPTIWDNSIDADDDPAGGDGGYDSKGNFVTPRAMRELIELREEIESLRAKLAEAEKDAERIEFLESLLMRKDRIINGYQYYKSTDIHITGPESCAIYARTGVGSNIDFQGHGKSVREAIDAAIAKQKGEKE